MGGACISHVCESTQPDAHSPSQSSPPSRLCRDAKIQPQNRDGRYWFLNAKLTVHSQQLMAPLYHRIKRSLPTRIPGALHWLSPCTGQWVRNWNIIWKTSFLLRFTAPLYYYMAADSSKWSTHSAPVSLPKELETIANWSLQVKFFGDLLIKVLGAFKSYLSLWVHSPPSLTRETLVSWSISYLQAETPAGLVPKERWRGEFNEA